MKIDEILKKFIDNLNKKAPIPVGNLKIKYPYKPALLLAILNIIDEDDLFNKDIKLDNSEIIKKYYDYIVINYDFWNYITTNQKSKEDWYLGKNNINVQKLILRNIIDMPADKFQSNNSVWKLNKKDKSIKITYNMENTNAKELKNFLIAHAINSLIDSNPKEYNFINENNFKDAREEYIQSYTLYNYDNAPDNINNKLRRIFAIEVKDRDGKCIICCNDIPEMLEACHIKPFSMCNNVIDKSNKDNGITLCRNHHRLFDYGYFTFSNEWKVIISNKKLLENDQNLYFRQFENCYLEISKKYPFENEYLKYHKKFIYDCRQKN